MAMSADMKPSSRENIQKTLVVKRGEQAAYRMSVGRTRRGRSGRVRLSPDVSAEQGFLDNGLMASRTFARIPAGNWANADPCENSTQGRNSMRLAAFVLLVSASVGLVGCGSSTGTRAVTGGLLGAGAGAGVSAVTGGRPATGALVGGGVGAVGGAVTHQTPPGAPTLAH